MNSHNTEAPGDVVIAAIGMAIFLFGVLPEWTHALIAWWRT